MTIETLEQKIKNRANERVQDRITACRAAIKAAIDNLYAQQSYSQYGAEFGSYGAYDDQSPPDKNHDYNRSLSAILRLALCDREPDPARAGSTKLKSWPARLWREEEERVRGEVLSKMDELQRMLLAKEPSADEPQPAE